MIYLLHVLNHQAKCWCCTSQANASWLLNELCLGNRDWPTPAGAHVEEPNWSPGCCLLLQPKALLESRPCVTLVMQSWAKADTISLHRCTQGTRKSSFCFMWLPEARGITAKCALGNGSGRAAVPAPPLSWYPALLPQFCPCPIVCYYIWLHPIPLPERW